MKNGKLILLLLLLIICSCNKDENYIESNTIHEHDHQHQEYALSHKSAGLDQYSAYKFQSGISGYAPPSPLLLDIKQNFNSMNDYNDWITSISTYGNIRWNWSQLNVYTDDYFDVIIPVFAEKKVKGLLRYIHSYDHYHFAFISLSDMKAASDNYTMIPEDENYMEYISFIIRLQYLSDGNVNLKMNELVQNYLKNYSMNTIITKNAIIQATVPYTYIEIKPIDITIYYLQIGCLVIAERVTSIQVPCTGGPGGSPNPTGVGGPPPPRPDEEEEEEDEEVELEKEIEISDEECKRMNMTEAAVSFLENELLNMTFPCNDKDHQGILDEIVEELCKRDSEDDTGLDGSDGSITMSDVDEVLGEYDRIDPTGLENCPFLDCILNNMIEAGNGTNENHLCDIFSSFSNQNLSLSFHIDSDRELLANRDDDGNIVSYPSIGSGNSGRTNANGQGSEIYLHPDFCGSISGNGAPFYALAVIYHEILHAEFYSWISEEYPNLYDWGKPANELNPLNLQYWETVLNANLPDYVGNSNQHNVMTFFIEEITHTLHELNGGTGSPNDYLYWAHLILNSARHNDNFTSQDLSELKEIFDQNVTAPHNGENNFGC